MHKAGTLVSRSSVRALPQFNQSKWITHLEKYIKKITGLAKTCGYFFVEKHSWLEYNDFKARLGPCRIVCVYEEYYRRDRRCSLSALLLYALSRFYIAHQGSINKKHEWHHAYLLVICFFRVIS